MFTDPFHSVIIEIAHRKGRDILEKQTDLANTVEDTNLEAQYDEACKRLLGNKEILAWILKTVVKEFKDCEVKEIAGRYIEGTPEIASVPVNPGETNAGIPRRSEGEAHSRVAGMNNEDSVYREGRIFYDIRFQAVYPKLGKLIRIYINVEAQKDFYPGYPIPKRGIFYCSRMISAQYHTEFEEPDYDEIKKVYSIWLCLNPSKKAGNTIARYAMGKEDLVGESDEQPENYDLLSVVQICLGGRKTRKLQRSDKAAWGTVFRTKAGSGKEGYAGRGISDSHECGGGKGGRCHV